jgi:cellulose 1,4-beta-cellobiosidase
VEEQKAVTIDSNWRWTHSTEGATNCYTGNTWDPTLCPDAATCSANCAIEGAGEEYENTYGVHASGGDLQLSFVTQGPYSTNIGSRVYLLEDEQTYKMFQLKNKEFTFDVDVSQLPCGLNGALYFVQMDADGGMSKYPGNKAGAKYGTGYCDAQCPHDIKFIGGEANSEGWEPSSTDVNSGAGKYGSCCTEFDVWEANSISTAYTAHACNVTEQTRCEGIACGDNDPTPGGSGGHRFDGVCDKNGCDFQPFRLGNETFWGAGSDFVLDTTKPVRVITQFLTDDNTDSGKLVEIRRSYRQGDVKIETPSLQIGKKGPFDSLHVDYCNAELELHNDGTNFLEKGGFDATDLAFEKGMVLALSLWDDHYANMLWLDSTYPADSTDPGTYRGKCDTSSGDPKDVESQHPRAFVKYMNIAYGELGTTDSGPIPGPSPPAPPGPGPSPSPGPTPSPPYQCGAKETCNCSPGKNNDGRNMESSARRASTADECCDFCQSVGNCVGWTWIPQSGNECWLKDQIGDLRDDGAVTSGSNGRSPTPAPTPTPSPTPSPVPSDCPGGSLDACLDMCPDDDADLFKACVKSCQRRCESQYIV